jgi:hypothetical protein
VGGTGTNCSSIVTNNTGTIYLGSGTSAVNYTFGNGLIQTTTTFTAGNALCLDVANTATVSATVTYEQH